MESNHAAVARLGVAAVACNLPGEQLCVELSNVRTVRFRTTRPSPLLWKAYSQCSSGFRFILIALCGPPATSGRGGSIRASLDAGPPPFPTHVLVILSMSPKLDRNLWRRVGSQIHHAHSHCEPMFRRNILSDLFGPQDVSSGESILRSCLAAKQVHRCMRDLPTPKH